MGFCFVDCSWLNNVRVSNVLFILIAITWSREGCTSADTGQPDMVLVVSDETSETCMCEMCSLISMGSTMIRNDHGTLSWCDPAQMFFTSKFSYLLFCNPTQKTEPGTANRWGTTNSKPHGPIIMMGQSETLITSQVLFITLFSAGVHRFGFTSHLTINKCINNLLANS